MSRVVGIVATAVALFGVDLTPAELAAGWAALALEKQATEEPSGDVKTQGGPRPVAPPAPSADELKVLARAAEEWVKNNPKGSTEAVEKPQVQQNKERGISPEEREKTGLPAPTWVAAHGKLQPAVREALDDQKKLIAKPDGMAAFQFDRPGGFQGTAYVDVYLRHHAKGKPGSTERQAAIKEAQNRLLRTLTAGEFSLFFAFENTAGLVGYVDESGLKKLLDDADVVAVGLDDQDRPEEPRPPLHEDPPPVVDYRGRTRPPRRPPPIGKVQADVYEALKKSTDGYLQVNVSLGGRLEHLSRPEDWRRALEEKEALERQMEDRILSTLTPTEFKVRFRGALLGGWANAEGLAKLGKHPDVEAVWLNERFKVRY